MNAEAGVRGRLRSRTARRLGVVLALALVAALAWTWWPGGRDTEVVVYFASSDGLYEGDEVRVLGVPVGTVEDITPVAEQVRVTVQVDGDVTLPAEPSAAIVAPSLVSSRYVQLAPRYDGGPTFESGGVVPIERTATPVEWDEVKEQINDLAVALGPNGANADGALGELVGSAAGALDGQGADIGATIEALSAAVTTLDDSAPDAVATVQNLQLFVSALALSNEQIATFTNQLDSVSAVLTADDDALRDALATLRTSAEQVGTFVEENRGRLSTTLSDVTALSEVVAAHEADIAQALHVAPNALTNLIASYQERQNAVAVDLHAANINSPGQLVCAGIGGAAGLDSTGDVEELCGALVGDLLDEVAGSPGTQELLDLLRLLMGAV
ncbi:MCE family protein [Nocardioides zeae]|uniref:MCE family protein n=1 Tax=Nocardioides zeae TaxID=1457234 RepID=A0A6P0HGE7_9ACTN|nr:MCE family protein [Nocardioides zeae]